MKKIKNLKKKIFGLTLVVGLLVLSIVGTTMAYFTDVDEKTNVFTSGNVNIEIEGNVFSEAGTVNTPVKAYPGMDMGDGVKVNNIGTENAFVGIIITLNKAIAKPVDTDDLDVTDLFKDISGVVEYKVTDLEGESNDKTEIFVVSNVSLAAGNNVTFFSDMVIPAEWDNVEMAIFNGLEINIAAYATQTYGFDNAETALRTAFDAWPDAVAGN